MTGIIYNSTFVDAAGKKLHGIISWDLSTPKQLEATLRPHSTTSEWADPIWTRKGYYSTAGLEKLISRLKSKAGKLNLTLISESQTRSCQVGFCRW